MNIVAFKVNQSDFLFPDFLLVQGATLDMHQRPQLHPVAVAPPLFPPRILIGLILLIPADNEYWSFSRWISDSSQLRSCLERKCKLRLTETCATRDTRRGWRVFKVFQEEPFILPLTVHQAFTPIKHPELRH